MDIAEQLRQQSGVIARRQAHACGLTANDIERLLRRRAWVRVFSGVYVNHTGPTTDDQREWAAILTCRRAALAGRSALRRSDITTGSDHEQGSRPRDIEIVIPHDTKIVRTPGVRATRRRDFASVVHPTKLPPTVRIEEAVLDVAQAASELNAVAIMSDACRSRRTTAPRLQRTAAKRSRLRLRAFLMEVLDDAAEGKRYLSRCRLPAAEHGGRARWTSGARPCGRSVGRSRS